MHGLAHHLLHCLADFKQGVLAHLLDFIVQLELLKHVLHVLAGFTDAESIHFIKFDLAGGMACLIVGIKLFLGKL
jgi:hypothetical protein